MARFSIEPKTRKYAKGYGFLSFTRKYDKQILDKGLGASRKEVHKAGQITDAVTKSKDDNVKNREPVEKIIIPLRKKRRNIKQIEKSIIKIERNKISKVWIHSEMRT